MIKYKQGEGRVGSFMIALFICLTLTVMFALMTQSFLVDYGKQSPSEFNKFNETYSTLEKNINATIKSQDKQFLEIEEEDEWYNKLTKRGVNGVKSVLYFSQDVVTKTSSGAKVAVGTLGLISESVVLLGSSSLFGFALPAFITNNVLLIIGLSIVLLGTGAFLRWKV